MGSLLSCFSSAEEHHRPPAQRGPRRRAAGKLPSAGTLGSSDPWSKSRSMRSDRNGEPMSHEDALLTAAAAVLLQQNGSVTLSFDRSSSVGYPSAGRSQKKQSTLPRSSSSRARSLTDPLMLPQQLTNQELKLDDLETNHFVLVHGGGFGAWCWYKTIALLEGSGFKVDTIDLTGAGIHSFETNDITSLAQYVKPLTSILEKLNDRDKVILVGHDFGGACISHAMEMFPSKVAKAVFVSAFMLMNGQSALDMFSQQAGTDDLMRRAQIFLYANGNDRPPTAIELDKTLIKELLFNESPVKDIALASVSMKPIPFTPVLEKLSLTGEKYGSVRRFYIESTEDNAVPLSLQQGMCSSSSPERVFRLKGSDHSPFFSKPQALHKVLVEISKIPAAQLQQQQLVITEKH